MVAYVFPTLQLSADGQSGASNAQADTFNEPKARRVASHPLAWSSMADLYRMLMGTAQSSNLLVRVCVCVCVRLPPAIEETHQVLLTQQVNLHDQPVDFGIYHGVLQPMD